MTSRVLTGHQAAEWIDAHDDTSVPGRTVRWAYKQDPITVEVEPRGYTDAYLADMAKHYPLIHPILAEMRALYDAKMVRIVDHDLLSVARVEAVEFWREDRHVKTTFTADEWDKVNR